MDITEPLAMLRRDIPGCHVAAFLDLSARMTLAHDARSKAPQERLDGLADRAQRLLSVPGLSVPDHAVALSPENFELFLRTNENSDDGLALVCGVDTDLDAALTQARAMLTGLNSHA
mgnify:CR=1 FL=1